MAGDFEIEVDFKNYLAGAGVSQASKFGGSGGTESGGEQKGASIFAKGLKMAGVVGFLANLKPITDLLGVLTGILSAGLGYLISVFQRYIEPYFKDPMRELIRLGIFIVNGMISGLETMTNLLLNTLSFGKIGSGENKVEFGRFREDIVLEAYDKMKLQIEQQEQGNTQVTNAYGEFLQAFSDSFLTEKDYEIVRKTALENQDSMLDSLDSVNNVFNTVDTIVTSTEDAARKSFNKINSFFDWVGNKFENMKGDGVTYEKLIGSQIRLGEEQRSKYGG